MIYQPREDSYLIQKHVRKYAEGRVLDMGTGSGILAKEAASSPNVREVVAVDINKKVIDKLNKEFSEEITKSKQKIKLLKSDLFSKVDGTFNLIICNPPYLPQDKISGKEIEDKAIYGGKKGWEFSEQFFAQASNYLLLDGVILYLFSSLTNKQKIEEILHENLFVWREVDQEKLSFETLYVYEIRKNPLLRKLESEGVRNIHFLTQGKRGQIYVGEYNKNHRVKKFLAPKKIVKVAIKVQRQDSKAQGRINNEINWLRELNKKAIGPTILFWGKNYFCYEFVEGEFIIDWLNEANGKESMAVIKQLMEQCFVLDKMGVNKEEMHHPLKHVLINKHGKVTLLDFERCTRTEKPHNVTQLVEFISRMKVELKNKQIIVDIGRLRELAAIYKSNYNRKEFESILKEIGAK